MPDDVHSAAAAALRAAGYRVEPPPPPALRWQVRVRDLRTTIARITRRLAAVQDAAEAARYRHRLEVSGLRLVEWEAIGRMRQARALERVHALRETISRMEAFLALTPYDTRAVRWQQKIEVSRAALAGWERQLAWENEVPLPPQGNVVGGGAGCAELPCPV